MRGVFRSFEAAFNIRIEPWKPLDLDLAWNTPFLGYLEVLIKQVAGSSNILLAMPETCQLAKPQHSAHDKELLKVKNEIIFPPSFSIHVCFFIRNCL